MAAEQSDSEIQEALSSGIVNSGLISPELLDAMLENGRPILITRRSKVVASITPTTAQEVFNNMVDSDPDLKRLAEELAQPFVPDFLGGFGNVVAEAVSLEEVPVTPPEA